MSHIQAISEFALKKKQAFAAMNVSDLVQWIMIHERIWKNLPEEFKNQTEARPWFDFVLFPISPSGMLFCAK